MKRIFEDERGKKIEKEYYELFGEYPAWSWETETVEQCYSRIEKEIENKKNELKNK